MSDFLILVLAVWRISSLLVNEDGPFAIFAELRRVVGVRYDAYNEAQSNNVIGQVFSCLWCASFWIGLIVMIAFYYFPAQTVLVCLPFALSAGAILVNKWTQ